MEYKKMNGQIYIRVDKDEKVLKKIEEVCQEEGIFGGHFQGIGACGTATLSTYLSQENDFTDHTISGMIEMISLFGNISKGNDKKPFIHSHAVFSYLAENGEIVVTAGHLKEATISYTGEIILTPSFDAINRQIDPKTGIEIWKL